VQKIRVLVANRPRLMRELVLATIADQPDIEIVGEAENDQEITELVERTRPDFLIIASEDPEPRPGICGFLLGRYPSMRILALGSGGRTVLTIGPSWTFDHAPFRLQKTGFWKR
jgi:DNA-binding NarL/FixJ family response regulator